MRPHRSVVRRRSVLKAIGAAGAVGATGGVASANGSGRGEGQGSPRMELVGHTTVGARDGANTHGAVNEALGLAAVGSFLSVDPEVRIVDVSDPAEPVLTGWVETGPGGDIRNSDIHPTEPLVFTANEGGPDAGWAVVDASDRSDPELLTHVSVEGARAGVHNVQTFGEDHVICALQHPDRGIVVYDVSDPGAPEEVSEFQVDGHVIHAAHVREEYVFLAHWNAGMWILDMSDPAEPEVVASFDYRERQEEADVPLRNCHHAVPHPTKDVVLLGEEVGGEHPGYKHVVSVDLGSGETELLSSFQFPQHARQPTGNQSFWWTGHFSDWGVGDQEDVVFSGDYKAGVQTFDLSDPSDPRRIHHYQPTEGVGEIRREDPDRLDLLDHVPFTWGAESSLAGDSGYVYTSDATTGLYVLELVGY